LRIGTAGWSIPARDKPSFPGEGSVLQNYARVLSAAEINSSFHRPHKRETYERWAASTPPDFGFSVKLPKAISHTARLANADDLLAAFAAQVSGLGKKLKVLLLQLPPSLPYDPDIAADFLEDLRRRFSEVGLACEPRHASWFGAEAHACFIDNGVARVAADPVLIPGGERPSGWTGLRYRRLHGSPRVYYSEYGPEYLATLSETMRGEHETGEPSWCIFDNTASGAATGDALQLQILLDARVPRKPRNPSG
jgi:uncharacterized protein YecE (DUF72 family)